MIVFDLRCSSDHVFEAWFASSDAWMRQAEAGLVSCPICGDTAVAKAVMAPNIAAKGNARQEVLPAKATAGERPVLPAPPRAIKAALAAIAQAQARLLERSEWVGRNFADRARAMHDGAEEHAPIHGQATADEARALVEDGVPVAPLLVPIVPPELSN